MKYNEDLKRLGKRIAELRTEKGLTQNNIADLCDIERSNIARIEAGNTNPTYLTLLKIANALNISISELLDMD